MRALIEACRAATETINCDNGKGIARYGALATVVKVEGSAYRQPGARMLILPDGRTFGAVSAGCLEKDIAVRALALLEHSFDDQSVRNKFFSPEIFQYSISGSDDDIVFGVGAGCNGTIKLLVEPIALQQYRADEQATARTEFEADNTVNVLSTCLHRRKDAVLAAVIASNDQSSASIGERLSWLENRIQHTTITDGEFQSMVTDQARRTLQEKGSCWHQFTLGSNKLEVFFEYVQPPIRLLIFGSGQDAQQLSITAESLGWQVELNAARIFLRTTNAGRATDLSMPVDSRTAAVIMTHNYATDLELLRRLFERDINYVGLLGPKHRALKLQKELTAMNCPLSAIQQACLYSPVGLDIGASTEAEVALSIAAEIQAVFAQRSGGQLRRRSGSIHGNCSVEQTTRREDESIPRQGKCL